jgi:hypothetical protein
MTAFSVDSEAVLSATGAIRATADRLQSETAAMLGQLTQLQGAWTGSAAVAFQGWSTGGGPHRPSWRARSATSAPRWGTPAHSTRRPRAPPRHVPLSPPD